MLIRSLLSIALLASFLVAPCIGVCEGWIASRHERMACCIGKAADEADACCASAEGRSNSDTASPPVAFPPAIQPVSFSMSAVAVPAEPAQIDRDEYHPLTAHANRHALLSVFLI